MKNKSVIGLQLINIALIIVAVAVAIWLLLLFTGELPHPDFLRIVTPPLDQESGQWLLIFQQSQKADYLWLEVSQDQTRLEGQGQAGWSISIDLAPRPDGTLGAFFGEKNRGYPAPVVVTVDHKAVAWGVHEDEKFFLFRVAEWPRFAISPENEGQP